MDEQVTKMGRTWDPNRDQKAQKTIKFKPKFSLEMGIKEIVTKVKNGYSIALMVDQRVSEGARAPFFDRPAHTTTIPAQLALKYNCKLVPIFLERKEDVNFEMTIYEPYEIQKTGNYDQDSKNITLKINHIIEKMITKNPTQWIWSHNRWK